MIDYYGVLAKELSDFHSVSVQLIKYTQDRVDQGWLNLHLSWAKEKNIYLYIYLS